MSNPSLPENKDIPLPWLGSEEDKVTQPWGRNERSDNVLLEIACQNLTIKDHQRCFLLSTMPRTIASILLYGCGKFAYFGVIEVARSIPMNPLLAIRLIEVMTVPFIASAIWMIFCGICVQVIAFRMHKARKKGLLTWLTWSITSEGIYQEAPSGKNFYLWSMMKKPVEFQGDLYIRRRKTVWGETLYMPRVAFTNREAAKRFHRAIVALWKSKGNPSVITEDMRAEFGPVDSV